MKQYGYIPSVIDKTHFVLGSVAMPYKVVREDGNWFASRPQKELQDVGFETCNCTGLNTCAQIESLLMELIFNGTLSDTTVQWLIDLDYIKRRVPAENKITVAEVRGNITAFYLNVSDRWVGIIAGTKPPGNDPQKVYEAIRKFGLIPDSMLPWTSDIQNVDEYYSFKGADKDACYAEGKKWLDKFVFNHAWVSTDANTSEERLNNLKVALKASPISRAVYAWSQDDRGIYVARAAENHWTFQWAEDVFSKIEDSYEPTLKDVDQPINYAKTIYIEERKTPIKVTPWQTFINLILRQWYLIKHFNE